MNDEVKKTSQQLAAEEREKISSVTNQPTKTEEKAEVKADDEKKEEVKEEEKKEEIKEPEKKDEVKAEEDELDTTEKDPEKLLKTIERLQKRVDKLTAKSKLTESEKNELIAKLGQVQEGKELLTEEDVEKRAETKAQQKVAERQFIDACNRLADSAAKVDKNFPDKVKEMAEEIGSIPSIMIGILDDLDNGGVVLNHLANNVDDAEKYYGMSPAKMAVELTKLSNKLVKQAEAKLAPKPISKVPEQTTPPGGSAKTDTQLRDNEPIEDWISKRNRQVNERLAAKRAGMR